MQSDDSLIKVSIDEQRLQLLADGKILMDVGVATAANGPGEVMHSECTPRGWHVIRAKIGAGCPSQHGVRRPASDRRDLHAGPEAGAVPDVTGC